MPIASPKPNIQVVPAGELAPAQQIAVLALCTRAYEEDFAPYLATLPNATHVLAYRDGVLVSHAAWVTRWLQIGDRPPLHTAYVEAVATEPAYERRGYATAVLQRLAEEIRGFEIGGLSPSDTAFYARLGWAEWRGPLAIRTDQGKTETPDEALMILRLPATPDLDLNAPISIEWREGEVW